MSKYEYTTDWFDHHIPIWKPILETMQPKRVLEVGSFEGRSAVFTIENCRGPTLDIYCIDTWEGGEEHTGMDFKSIEQRFDENIRKATENNTSVVIKLKGRSIDCLSKLVSDGEPKFDFIYIDGSHLAKDVITDAVLAFDLLNVGGTLIFDDYLKRDKSLDELHHPHIAIDLFMYLFRDKMAKLNICVDGVRIEELVKRDFGDDSLYQMYLQKISS